MCRDLSVGAAWRADPLCHDTGTLEQLDGMLRRAEALDQVGKGEKIAEVGNVVRDTCSGRAASRGGDGATVREGLPVPVLMLHGSADQVTHAEASMRLFESLRNTDKALKIYAGAYHKLHVETKGVKEEYLEDVSKWILERVAANGMDRGLAKEGDEIGQTTDDVEARGPKASAVSQPKL